jgi:hypothetical protein
VWYRVYVILIAQLKLLTSFLILLTLSFPGHNISSLIQCVESVADRVLPDISIIRDAMSVAE